MSHPWCRLSADYLGASKPTSPCHFIFDIFLSGEEKASGHWWEVANVLITQCYNTFEILQNINLKSRSFDAFDLPYVIDPNSQDYTFGKVLGSVCSDLSPPSDVVEAHRKQLQRNLAAFDLKVDEVVDDGDFAFTSIIKQLYKAVPNWAKEGDSYIRSLGLLKSEEQDTFVPCSASNVC